MLAREILINSTLKGKQFHVIFIMLTRFLLEYLRLIMPVHSSVKYTEGALL